jgi:hypothetical protein
VFNGRVTWAQATFAYCFLVLVPLVGIFFRRRWKLAGKSPIIGFFFGAALMFFAMIGCCVLAKASFPHYPNQDVSEWVANAFTLPAILAVMATFKWPPPNPERKAFFKRWAFVLVSAYVLGIGFTRWSTLWPHRRALPWSASEIHERSCTDMLLPDFDYYLKAKISRPEFLEYVGKFGLEKEIAAEEYGSGKNNDWWDPSGKVEAYSLAGKDWSMRAIYCRGYIYVHADRM